MLRPVQYARHIAVAAPVCMRAVVPTRACACTQISSFSVHHSGALLLESRDGETLDAALRRTARRSSAGGPQGAAAPAGCYPALGAEAQTDSAAALGGQSDNDDQAAGVSLLAPTMCTIRLPAALYRMSGQRSLAAQCGQTSAVVSWLQGQAGE